MEVKLIKDWERRHGVIKKGTIVEVDNFTYRDLISKKIARPVRDVFPTLARLIKKDVQDDSTKQTASKYKQKKKRED